MYLGLRRLSTILTIKYNIGPKVSCSWIHKLNHLWDLLQHGRKKQTTVTFYVVTVITLSYDYNGTKRTLDLGAHLVDNKISLVEDPSYFAKDLSLILLQILEEQDIQ
jgi:hypothetical protein